MAGAAGRAPDGCWCGGRRARRRRRGRRASRGGLEGLKARIPSLCISRGQQKHGALLYAGYVDNTRGYTDVLELGVGDVEELKQLSEEAEYQKSLEQLSGYVDSLVVFDYED